MFYFSLIFAFTLDFITKSSAQNYLTQPIPIFGDMIYFEKYINHGIAFSIPLHGLLLKVITIVLICGIGYYYAFQEEKNTFNNIGYGFLLGGALGNAYERIFIGGVTDFIGVKYFSVFNFADSFIFIGILILIISNYAKGRTTTK